MGFRELGGALVQSEGDRELNARRSGSQVMASYMALREGWVDAEGNVEPIEFEGESSRFASRRLADEVSLSSPRYLQGALARSLRPIPAKSHRRTFVTV